MAAATVTDMSAAIVFGKRAWNGGGTEIAVEFDQVAQLADAGACPEKRPLGTPFLFR
jgi:hypothetical protein